MSTAPVKAPAELNAAARAAARCRSAWLARVRITDPGSGAVVPELFASEVTKVYRDSGRPAPAVLPEPPEPATVAQVLAAAAGQENRPLMKLRLRMLLRFQPGWGAVRADQIIDHVLSVTGAKLDRRLVTVAWLLDPRAGGRRYTAWLDAIEPKKDPPWPGFPHTRSSSN